MSAAHTPGPWAEPCNFGSTRFEVQGGGRQVAVVNKIADARLIWAAPDLFESANAALDALTDERADAQFKTDVARMLRAAIAKAVTQ